jgi:hypothetical protein
MPDLLNQTPKAAPRTAAPRPPRPRGPASPPPPSLRRRSRVLTGITAALAAAAVGLLLVEAVCLIAWIAEPRSAAPLSAALRTGAAFWLLGHGGRLGMPAGTVALIPLGLSVLFAALLARAGAAVARVRPSGPRRKLLVVCAVTVAIPHTVITTVVAAGASGGGLQPSIWTASLGAFVIAAAAAAIGGARAVPVVNAKPSPLRAVGAAIAVAGAVLFAVSALVAALALMAHVSDAAALARPEKAGAVGGFGLLMLQAALTPNAVMWSASYVLGPGFAIGAGTLVSPTGVHLGDVPGLPMLAALPAGSAPWPVYALFLVPPAAGVLAGVVLIRRLGRTPKLLTAGLLSLGVALAISLLMGTLAALSGGPVTRGRLGTIGPSFLQTGVAALEIGVPAIVAALALTWHRQRHRGRVAAPPPPLRERLRRLVAVAKARSAAVGLATAAFASRIGCTIARPFGFKRQAAPEDQLPAVIDLTKHDPEHQSAQSAIGLPLVSSDDDEPPTEELEVVRPAEAPKAKAKAKANAKSRVGLRTRRRKAAPARPAPAAPPVAEPPPVSLEKSEKSAPAGGVEKATEKRQRRGRPRLPSRLRRKPKVIKLPD